MGGPASSSRRPARGLATLAQQFLMNVLISDPSILAPNEAQDKRSRLPHRQVNLEGYAA
jgi:hypothetical protein